MNPVKSSSPNEFKNDVENLDRLQLHGKLLEGASSPIVGEFDADYFANLRHIVVKTAFTGLPEQLSARNSYY